MDSPTITHQVSVSEELTDRTESRFVPNGTRPGGIFQTNRKAFNILICFVLSGILLFIGIIIGQSLPQDNLPTQTRNILVWCTDEDIDFMGANLVPKKKLLKGTRQNQRPTAGGSRQGESSSPEPLGNIVGVMNRFDRDCGRQIMPSAHLFLDWNRLKTDKSKLPWQTNTEFSHDTGHISNEIIYRPQYGGLEVTQSGIYNVYCQVTFRPTSYVNTRFVQCLFRNSPRNETNAKAVVCTQTTKMNVTDVEIVQPVRLQAAIKVNIGDILYVNVSELDSVYPSSDNNYFGIFKIS